jgi:hypothetical protein
MQTLDRIPFFKDSADVDLSKFDRRCTWKRYEENEIIVDFEDATTDVYFIVFARRLARKLFLPRCALASFLVNCRP